jgi:hypothetical protein
VKNKSISLSTLNFECFIEESINLQNSSVKGFNKFCTIIAVNDVNLTILIQNVTLTFFKKKNSFRLSL